MSLDKENTRKLRPISPHLSIYKLQISSALSIGHRLSGIGLFVALAAFCWWFILWVFSKFEPCYLDMLDNNIVKTFLILVSYGFFYHSCTGLRHLVWDTGRGFSICAIDYSGYVVVIGSFILTAIFWLCM